MCEKMFSRYTSKIRRLHFDSVPMIPPVSSRVCNSKAIDAAHNKVVQLKNELPLHSKKANDMLKRAAVNGQRNIDTRLKTMLETAEDSTKALGDLDENMSSTTDTLERVKDDLDKVGCCWRRSWREI